jgi:membrane-bound ClpP family serine protease
MTLGILLVLSGLLFLFLEFFMPGGILALTGAILVFSGIVVFCNAATSWLVILLFFIATSFGIVFTVVSALTLLKRGAKSQTFYQDQAQEGYLGAQYERTLIGKNGKAMSDLRPSGWIEVEGERVQAVARTGFILKGSRIAVVSGEGAHLVVEEIEEVTLE